MSNFYFLKRVAMYLFQIFQPALQFVLSSGKMTSYDHNLSWVDAKFQDNCSFVAEFVAVACTHYVTIDVFNSRFKVPLDKDDHKHANKVSQC